MWDSPEQVDEFLGATGISPTAIQRDMAERASREGFPIIGPDAGGLLTVLASLVNARRVFEFGSGFGYSASWFLRGMPTDGVVVLTERDGAELDQARAYFERAGELDRVRFERGDAIEIVDRFDAPFDIVLLDHEKARYVDGFEAARGKLGDRGMIIADNMMHGPFSLADVMAGLSEAEFANDRVRGIVAYLDRLRAEEKFLTTVLPVGSGIAVSTSRP